MSGTRLMITALQLMDPDRGIAVATSGGKATVCVAGTARKATLYDPDTGAALANPVSLSRGMLRFAVLNTVTLVDIYGFAPDGGFFVRRNVKPGQESEVNYSTDQVEHTAVLPAAVVDYNATATEAVVGLQFTAGSILLPHPILRVATIDATETINVGLLSTDSGGDADGFMNGVALGTAGSINPSTAAASLTLGALFVEAVATTPVVNGRKSHTIVSTAVSPSVIFSSGSDTAEVFLMLPYLKPPV